MTGTYGDLRGYRGYFPIAYQYCPVSDFGFCDNMLLSRML